MDAARPRLDDRRPSALRESRYLRLTFCHNRTPSIGCCQSRFRPKKIPLCPIPATPSIIP
jgi:hypothetical protein